MGFPIQNGFTNVNAGKRKTVGLLIILAAFFSGKLKCHKHGVLYKSISNFKDG